jgi:hypothetical protein
MSVSQLLVWTALPNGYDSSGALKLSVFLAPQLTADIPVGDQFAALSLFPDFANWPQAINQSPDGPITFTVTLSDGVNTFTENATNVTPAPPVGINPADAWAAIFDPNATSVNSFTFTDYSQRFINSFPAADIEAFVASLYGTLGTIAATNPLILSVPGGRDSQVLVGGPQGSPAQDVVDALISLASVETGASTAPSVRSLITSPQSIPDPSYAFGQLRRFHEPLANPTFAVPTPPVLDFHQGLTGLNHYPVLLRLFNLVYDLTVPVPSGLNVGSITVQVNPLWHSQLGSANFNVRPLTATTYSATQFAPTPLGTDYVNGMLDLSDTTRFMVSDLDHDLAGDRLLSTGASLATTQAHQKTRSKTRYNAALGELALTVPALRSSGPQIIWSGYAYDGGTAFSGLLQAQQSLNNDLDNYLNRVGDLPLFNAENLIRGHRFDVYCYDDVSPTWRSLMGREGTYVFGPNVPSAITTVAFDEGIVTPAAAQKVDTSDIFVPLDLWVHESIARWHGWGLSSQRPGTIMDRYNSSTTPNPNNLPPKPTSGQIAQPQLSAFFSGPNAKNSLGTNFLYPKLRFGYRYAFRARGVDLAGNSIDVSSSDATTATAQFTHYRYEPIRPPVLAGMAPFTPGEGTYYLTILDYQVLGRPTTVNGRWLFPPSVSQLMSEEHGMLDGFVFGQAPDPTKPPAFDAKTYTLLTNLDKTTLSGVTNKPFHFYDPANPEAGLSLIGTFDPNNQNVPYFTGTPQPWTPWFPDPLSYGPILSGLPGTDSPTGAQWNGTWPQADPMLIALGASSEYSTNYVAPQGGEPGMFQVTLPPAAVANVRVSSALEESSLDKLGVWQWFGPGGDPQLAKLAQAGQVWLLTPFTVLRMVHAVRKPLLAPSLGSPVSSRLPGETSVDLADPQFQVDTASTGHIDVMASWTDRYDNPLDAASDPGALASAAPAHISHVSSSGPAFKLTIPDPNPLGPESQPMTIHLAPESFAFGASDYDQTHEQSATHHIGDTRHHLVQYTATGTSRFAELFSESTTAALFPGSSSVKLGDASTGLNVNSIVVIDSATGDEFVKDTDWTVDPSTQMFSLVANSAHPSNTSYIVDITFQPDCTLEGSPWPVHVLSSARPKAPVISQIVPAWMIEGPTGTLATGIKKTRTGGFLRVYFERPWFSSGDGELVGVVTTVANEPDASVVLEQTQQQGYVTMMGLDPINYQGASTTPWPVVPTKFSNLAVVPEVPYRSPYAHPPQVYLKEDQSNLYQVWPYDVQYDESTGRWYADIAPRPGVTDDGTYPPPPGYFIRLALCRFQPFSVEVDPTVYETVEVSPVVMATFAQPVPDRAVTVVANSADKSHTSVLVSVTGPGYQGWRTPIFEGNDPTVQYDADNKWAPQNPSIYNGHVIALDGSQHTSTIVVEVQVQDPVLLKSGFGTNSEMVWKAAKAPVELAPSFSGEVFVTWGSTKPSLHGSGVVTLPAALGSTTKMRLRISEIDYYEGASAPTTVNTNLRRPFVTFVDIN